MLENLDGQLPKSGTTPSSTSRGMGLKGLVSCLQNYLRFSNDRLKNRMRRGCYEIRSRAIVETFWLRDQEREGKINQCLR